MSSLVIESPEYLSGVIGHSTTLVDLLEWRARVQPDREAYSFLVDGATVTNRLTWRELHQRALMIACQLTTIGAEGKPVLLLYPSDLEYVAAFFGCLQAGAIAVPAYPPRLNRTLDRLQAIVADSQARFALSVSSIRDRLEPLCEQLPNLKSLRWISTDNLAQDDTNELYPPDLTPDTPAFLQYTSGSTSQPKGVMVSHRHLIHNEQMIQQAFQQTESSIIVGWLPLYHDMGLIGNVLQTLYVGARCILMSPAAFLQSPFSWLQAISTFAATTSGGPNFAYDLCVRKITEEQRAQLDLSSWKVAFNGAEPIRPESLKRFAETFASCGFRPEAFHPCYGLAEATLFVSGKTCGSQPRVKLFDSVELIRNRAVNSNGNVVEGRTLVSCGVPFCEQKVVIVNPESLTECSSGEVGEIWIAGESVAGGYWNKPEATAYTFNAQLAGDENENYLRTGDLGFLDAGELYVTGRLKDLIIIRGLNHYPQDIENTAELSHTSLRAGCGAAFSVEVEGDERLVIVYEVQRHRAATDQEIIDAIRQRVSEEHEVQVYAVSLIRTGTISKTSSGKIQRNACRLAFLNGDLNVEAEWRETSVINRSENPVAEVDDSHEAWLQSTLAILLNVEPKQIDIHQPITRYGLDSLIAAELLHSIEERFGITVSLSTLLQSISVADLSEQLRGVTSEGPQREDSIESKSISLSSSQQSLWFLHQLAPEDPTYNLAFAARIHGSLDVNSLRTAFQTLVDRHASLRTTFTDGDGEPVQQIHEHATVFFEEHDAAQWDAVVLDERLLAEAQRPFDLEHGPLLKVHLFKRDADESIMLLTAHHIIVDLWSLTVLIHELGTLYNGRQSGVPVDLPPVTHQYVDYVRWQNDLLQSESGKNHRQYWQEQLGGPLPMLSLPTDRARPAVQTYHGAAHSFSLTPQLTRRLKSLSRENDATLYMTLLAAFEVLLSRYAGQQDILVGSPTSGRTRNWMAGMIGYLVNPVVLRANISGDEPFAKFLQQVRQTVLAAFEHQDYPFAQQVKDLQPERDPSRSPLFQVMFTLQKSHLRNDQSVAAFAVGQEGAQLSLGNVALELFALPQRTSRFDLTLDMAEVGEQLAGSLEYNTDLFEAATVERMSEHFERLLESIVTEPGTSVSRLPMFSRKEQQLLAAWNDTSREFPAAEGLHRLFEAQVKRTPLATALVAGTERLSYHELNERANRLAHHLIDHGVGVDHRVGIFLDRSTEMVVAQLGVLKAGGCFVPLDPEYPLERLAFTLKDAGLTALLTTRKLAQLFGSSATDIALMFVDELDYEHKSAANPLVQMDDQQLAYLIYTSGSTGQPKGVGIEHSSAINFMRWASEIFDPETVRGVLFSTSICFDISMIEVFVTLSYGGQIILADNALQLLQLAAANEVNLINTVPSAMAELVRMRAVPESVRVVVLGGEASNQELVDQIYANTQVEKIYNLYGPTETTIYSTYTPLRSGERVTIGRPITNTQIYVLDQQWQPVPVGVVGDLYIGGSGLARGYWKRPDLTADKFIPDGFSGEEGARLYKTGDKARYLANGELEFLGRADHQVKIRGYRIELGDIESVLRQHGQVREAIVVAREQAGEEKQLVAYVAGGEEVTAAELRNWIRERLPKYMTPAAFVLMKELPLTPNGKVNRKALPDPEFNGTAEKSLTNPRTQIEEILLSIWADVLGVRQLGVDDNFFELGGHSLMATRLISRVRNELKVEVPLSRLFESPTVASCAANIEELIGDNKGVLYKAIEPAPRDVPLPLSFAQQRLWFLDQMESGSAFYNISGVVRLRGQLNVGALEQSFSEIVRRHETLRTRFEVVDGQPTQVISPSLTFVLPLVDLSELSEEAREREVERRAAEEAQTPFDLSAAGLLRTTLLKLADEDHALLLTVHHIVSDAWSLGILVKELTVLYESYNSGQPSPLPELGVQYADFARWQQEWLRGDALATQMAYWQQHLAGAPALINFPTDRPRPPVQKFEGTRHTFVLPRDLVESLKSFSRRQRATPFMSLLAVFQTLLFRYTGQTDIVVGTPIAGRNRADIENLIGFFVNTQAIRTHLTGEMGFNQLLAQVRTAVLEAHARQDLPFEKLVEELQPERSLSHTPIFQVMFALQNVPMPDFELPGLTVATMAAPVMTSKFDFSLSLEEKEEGLVGDLEYNTDLFDATTMTRLVGHYRQLLEDVINSNAEKNLGNLQMLTRAERQQLLIDWNYSAPRLPATRPVHQRFERQTEATPEAPAVICDDVELSYRELNRRANVLAHRLRRLGVGSESVVGLCAERSFDLVIGALGILKAGGAYVPLDPNYPRERLSYMLEDCGASVVLTQRVLLEKLPTQYRASAICLDDSAWDKDTLNPAVQLNPENVAYVIYTSGSTGRPKGVSVSHAALSNLVSWHLSAFNVSRFDRATLLAGVGFDASVWELWPYLSCGASIDIPPNDIRSSPEGLRDWLTERGVTITFVPTPVADPMIGLEWSQEAKLRTLLTGGDRLHTWPSSSLPFTVINNYGPTENAVVSTSGLVGPEAPATGVAPTLGRPINNVGVYIVDERGEPVPVGVTGELLVGGDSLARCYLGRPEMTAEMFVPDAFSGRAGARLYRTGDLARYLPDGSIEFLGRIGSQVKVRGHRIELGEIETALREAAGVREAVVQYREQNLVAYVVPDIEVGTVTINYLRDLLREKLPDYMMPAFFVMLDELPITDNGKIDRQALPAPVIEESDDDTSRPSTPTEELLSQIWMDILRLRRVKVNENFFELGGHSLLATQVVSRVRETFNVELPLRALFESPTIAELAQSVEKSLRSQTSAPIERVSRDGDLPLSFAQQRLWFLDQLSPSSTAYNIQVAVRMIGSLDHPALEKALNEIIRRHESLRTSFAVRDGLPVQVIAPEYFASLPLLDISDSPSDATIERIYREEGRDAFDLGKVPLFRFKLLKIAETEHVLLLNMHHVISDGWSMGVITRELASHYEAFSSNQSSALPELAIQYADFSHWQRKWLQCEVLGDQLAYWKAQLGHQLPILNLPTDRQRPKVQTFRGARHHFTLPAELAESLKSFSRREGVTLYMLALAAFKVLLHRYSGQDDIVVGTDIANRNRSEIEPLIGFFANQLVLRTDLSGNPTFRELLGRVREVTLGAYAHQDTPFEKLVEELQPERDFSRNPLFQVMFIFQNNPMPALEIGNLAIEPIEMKETTTAFDISLVLNEPQRGEINGSVRYSTDLFDASTIERLIGNYKQLLQSIVADGDARIDSLEMLTGEERMQSAVNKEERKDLKLKKLMGAKPKAFKLSEETIIRESLSEAGLPIVFQPEYDGVDLVAWASQNLELIDNRLKQYGAILFRGFNTRSLDSFRQVATAVSTSLMSYGERSSPRHALSGNIYTSTDHPADQHILLHNEQSYTLNWPMKIFFSCVRPAQEGGRTPIADSRRIFNRLPSSVVEKFVQKQVMYVRNYGDNLGLSWQEAFQTEDKQVVEEHCRRDAIEFEWKDENRLRTKQIRPAVRTHPRTGETVWFNHAVFFNVQSLEPTAREALRSGIDDMDLPFNTFYGDGSPIEASVIEQIYDTYRQEQVAFDWQAGDILMLDNMLVAHGREPFVAPREIAVAMADGFLQYR